MKIPAQLVNLLGIVVTAAILVAGVALLALPIYGQSQTTESEARTVAQTNEVYATQVSALEKDAKRLPDILATVGNLQTGIPPQPKLDDVHELVNTAAGEAGAVVVSVTVTGPDAWTPRTQIGQLPGTTTAPAPSAAAVPGAEADASTDASAAPATDAAAGADGAAPADSAAGEGAEASPQQQVTATITVEVPDASSAAAFLQVLRGGPRLIGVDRAVLTDADDGALELVVTAFAFVRAEN
jgi:hypothetical protein